MNTENKSITILIILSSILFLKDCKCNDKSDNPDPAYKIAGRIYKDCSKTPLSNYPIKIYQKYEVGLGYKIEEAEALGSTDSLGFFSISFTPNRSGQDIVLKCDATNNSSTILEGIPRDKNVEDIVAFKSATACIKVILNVSNPHSSGETFTITDLRTFSPLNLPCPISSGLLYIVPTFPSTARYYDFYESKYLTWNFNNNTASAPRLNFKIDRFCNDTITLIANVD